MNNKANKRIYKEILTKNIEIKHACEVGVYLPETSNIVDFIYSEQTLKITLVEPNPRIIKKIEHQFEGIDKIVLHPVAIHDYEGTLNLFEAEASTFAEGLSSSPALINDKYEKSDIKKIATPCKKFDQVDSNDIDLLSIDTEGCEWYILKNMNSRPKVISIETHGKFYTNPFIKEIKLWLDKAGYKVWYKTKSDSVYIKNELFSLTLSEHFRLFLMSARIALRKAKRIFYS